MSMLAKMQKAETAEPSPAPVLAPAVVGPRVYRVLHDFGAMVGSSFQKFVAGQHLNERTERHLIDALLISKSPIELEGERTLETCPKCHHVFSCVLEKK